MSKRLLFVVVTLILATLVTGCLNSDENGEELEVDNRADQVVKEFIDSIENRDEQSLESLISKELNCKIDTIVKFGYSEEDYADNEFINSFEEFVQMIELLIESDILDEYIDQIDEIEDIDFSYDLEVDEEKKEVEIIIKQGFEFDEDFKLTELIEDETELDLEVVGEVVREGDRKRYDLTVETDGLATSFKTVLFLEIVDNKWLISEIRAEILVEAEDF